MNLPAREKESNYFISLIFYMPRRGEKETVIIILSSQ